MAREAEVGCIAENRAAIIGVVEAGAGARTIAVGADAVR